MNKKLKSILLSVTTIISATAIVVAVVSAGSLNPTAGPGSTMYTMEEIHNRLLNGDTTAIENDHDFDPSADPTTGTMHTLKDIYDLIPPANQVLSTYTPTGGTPWGTATKDLVWQPVPFPELCWDSNQSCEIDVGVLDPLEDGSVILGAMEYCTYLNWAGDALNCDEDSCTQNNYWHLPTIGELMKGLADQFIDNSGVTGFQGSTGYWSSSEYSESNVWRAYWAADFVGLPNNPKNFQSTVRCAR